MLLLAVTAWAQKPDEPAETVALRKLVAATPRLPHRMVDLKLSPGTEMEMVSSAAVDAAGLIYILQRGTKADPVIVANPDGTVLRSWGRGLYTIPHSIRIDGEGNVWTVDAGDSHIRKFSAHGRPLLDVVVKLPEKPKGAFCGATDVAFLRDGAFLVADGYQNARVVEFSREGKRVKQWGTAGTGPGEFHTPHGIAVDANDRVYVADRENGRVQWFDREGRYRGMWTHTGKAFSLKVTDDSVWIGTQPRNVPNGAEGWLMRLDPESGKVQGLIESFGHSIEVAADGRVLTGRRPGSLLVFAR
ncbi:MAG: 6-bladed beta-propeller [Acidobacteria bacterium]|nr:6-bladed beta-propeller [Acidobacteriota bacterium]